MPLLSINLYYSVILSFDQLLITLRHCHFCGHLVRMQSSQKYCGNKFREQDRYATGGTTLTYFYYYFKKAIRILVNVNNILDKFVECFNQVWQVA